MKVTSTSAVTAFEAMAHSNAKLLILGSMPGVASLEVRQYYAHPRNAFWFIMQELFGIEKAPQNYVQKTRLLQRAQVALWDVLHQCIRPGSLDTNIDPKSVVCNDFAGFLKTHPHIRQIAFNGKAAEQLFKKRVLPELLLDSSVQLITLPSTSPAMASLTKQQKAAIWRSKLLS